MGELFHDRSNFFWLKTQGFPREIVPFPIPLWLAIAGFVPGMEWEKGSSNICGNWQ